MVQERLAQYRDQLFCQQAAYSNHLSEGVTAQPLIGVKRLQNSFRTEKKIMVVPPQDIIGRLSDTDIEAIKWVSQIDVIDYDSGKPGDLLFVTSGMHGEETLGELAAENLDDEMKEYAKDIKKGKVLLLPRINTLGYINKTRNVFPDEVDTNLNNVCDQYKTGEWEEFLGLESKTAKYGWLLMRYIVSESNNHKDKFGNEYQVRLIDLHRDDRTAIPYNRIDRMYENPETLSRLFNAFRTIPVPLVLEDKNWEVGYEQALSSSATVQGILACTIEEGKTSDPDQFAQPYISHEITQFLVDQGIIIVDPAEWNWNTEKMKSLHRITAIRRSRALAEDIVAKGRIFCLDYREGSYINQKSWDTQSSKDVLTYISEQVNWDGFLTVAYNTALRGLSARKIGGDGSPSKGLGNIVFRKEKGNFLGLLDPPLDMVVQSPQDLPDEWFIVSVPESFMKDSNIMHCGFIYDEGKRTIMMKSFRNDDKDPQRLNSDQIRKMLKDESVKVDFSPIEITYAVPDFRWRGIREADGNLKIIPIQ